MQAEQAHQKAQLPGGFPAWQPQRVRALVGVSGVYNCFDLADHFNRRGLYRKLFDKIMSINGQPNLKLFSPTYCIKASASSPPCHDVWLLPHVLRFFSACAILVCSVGCNVFPYASIPEALLTCLRRCISLLSPACSACSAVGVHVAERVRTSSSLCR